MESSILIQLAAIVDAIRESNRETRKVLTSGYGVRPQDLEDIFDLCSEADQCLNLAGGHDGT